jgi:methylamine dehydrogenase heavy chain
MAQDSSLPPLPIEPTGIVETLPKRYPESWFLVHDASFSRMSDGTVYVVDALGDTVPQQNKGMFNISLIGNLGQSAKRGEIYAIETFHSRGTRGDRLDVLTIWDSSTLFPVAEVVWPIPKRFIGLPQRYAVTPIDGDRLLLVSNFNPAASVTVIDLDSRQIVNEVATPGCVFNYPTGSRGFSSLCSNGSFMTTELAENGSIVKQTRNEPFFSSDETPIFETPAIIDGMAYFPSFAGLIHPVDFKGKIAKVGAAWSLVPEEERSEGWRPGGVGIIDRDDQGRLYVLMHPEGFDGSHRNGGAEVWVFDPTRRQRVQRIALREWGITIAIGRGANPLMMVTNPTNMSLEVYDAGSGEFIRTISELGQQTPLMIHASAR